MFINILQNPKHCNKMIVNQMFPAKFTASFSQLHTKVDQTLQRVLDSRVQVVPLSELPLKNNLSRQGNKFVC